MIARIWSGSLPADRAEEYLALMRDVAVPDYRATAGNLGAWCLSRTAGDVTTVRMLTFWTDLAAIARFAGDDVERAKYYDFDADFLLEMPATVEHWEMFGEAAAALPGAEAGSRRS